MMYLSLAALILALDVVAANINSTVEYGIETACKVCPWQKCINTKAYPFYDEATEEDYSNVTLVCWTRGENVGGADGNKYVLLPEASSETDEEIKTDVSGFV